MLTIININLDWKKAPQHPQKATIKIVPPKTSNSTSIDNTLCCGTNVGTVGLANRNQRPAPMIPQAHN